MVLNDSGMGNISLHHTGSIGLPVPIFAVNLKKKIKKYKFWK